MSSEFLLVPREASGTVSIAPSAEPCSSAFLFIAPVDVPVLWWETTVEATFDGEPQPVELFEFGAGATCDDSCVGAVVGGWLVDDDVAVVVVAGIDV